MTASRPNSTLDRLRAAAAGFDAAADRAFTVVDAEQRRQDARTLRVVIAMAADRRGDGVPAAWLDLWLESANRLLDYYDRMDMDVVHGSRMLRREKRAAELGEAAR